MTDLTFGRKSSKKEPTNPYSGFGGSLALRVFLVTIIFLVLPLFIYCLMMFRYDAILKQSEQARTLDLVSDVQVLMFQNLIDRELRSLELISLYLEEEGLLEDDKQAIANEKLKKINIFENVNDIFVLRKNPENKISCILSSSSCDFMSFYNTLFFLPSLAVSKYAVAMNEEPLGKENKLYFVKVLKRGPQGEVLETLNIAISMRTFIGYLTNAQGYKDVYSLAIFRKKDFVVVDGQDPSLIGKSIRVDSSEPHQEGDLVLKSIPKEAGAYEYTYNGERRYATILPLAQLDFDILISRKQFDYSQYLRGFFQQIIVLFVCILIFGTIGAWILTYLMANPLKKLCIVMTKVGDQELSARYEKSPYGFEINRVGNLFNTMIEKLLYNLEKLQRQTIKQEKLQQELELGQQIQKSLVPKYLPEVPGIEIHAILVPATEVGGDFYDFFINPSVPDELLLVMADTSGHGVFGCFYALTMRSILRSLGSTMTDLKEVIIEANRLFCKDSSENQVFVTTWMGSYNHRTHVLRYTSCGHPLGFVFRDNKLYKELVTPGIALGVIEEMEPTIDSVELQRGDTLVLITDGVIETWNPQGEIFGKALFIQTIEKYCSLPAIDLFESFIQEIEAFEGDPERQEDDATMVVIRIK